MRLIKLLAAVASICLILSACSVKNSPSVAGIDYVKYDVDAAQISDGYITVARNGGYTLDVDTSSGNFKIINTASGKEWYSVPPDGDDDKITNGISRSNNRSQVVVGYIYINDLSMQSEASYTDSFTECLDGGIITELIENGIRVTYHFSVIGLELSVEYILTENGLNVCVPYDRINEGDKIALISLKILPAFGAGNEDSDGYIVVPDGSGAVINFNNGVTNGYEKIIYGSEIDTTATISVNSEQKISLPVFGMISGNDGFSAFIKSGAKSAGICAQSGSERYRYNTVSSKLYYRVNSPVIMFDNDFSNKVQVNNWMLSIYDKDFSLEYRFLSGDSASYSGIAASYREYLEETGAFSVGLPEPALHLDLYGCIDKSDAFLGFKYTKLLSLTTFSQAKEIVETLRKKGINEISLRYIGWANSGVRNKTVPRKVSFLSKLGGKKGFDDLNSFLKKSDIDISYSVDLNYYKTGNKSGSLRTSAGKLIYKYDYLRSVYVRKNTTPMRVSDAGLLLDASTDYLESYLKTGAERISFINLASCCFADYGPDDALPRSEMAESCNKILENCVNSGLRVTLEDSNAYALPYTDTVVAVPMSSSGYKIFDYDIPLYQIVLHGKKRLATGSFSQSSDRDLLFLSAVESGTEPLYTATYNGSSLLRDTDFDYLYSSDYMLWLDEAVDYWERSHELLYSVYDKIIVNHKYINSYVTQTTYENGVNVTVNFGDNDFVTDEGVTVAAGSFIATAGEE